MFDPSAAPNFPPGWPLAHIQPVHLLAAMSRRPQMSQAGVKMRLYSPALLVLWPGPARRSPAACAAACFRATPDSPSVASSRDAPLPPSGRRAPSLRSPSKSTPTTCELCFGDTLHVTACLLSPPQHLPRRQPHAVQKGHQAACNGMDVRKLEILMPHLRS